MFTYNHVETDGSVTLKKGGVSFSVLPPDAYQSLSYQAKQKGYRTTVVGSTKFKKAKEDALDTLQVESVSFSTVPPTMKSIKYYVPIKSSNPSELQFISVEKGSYLPFLLLVPLLLCGLSFTVAFAMTDKNTLEIEQGQDIGADRDLKLDSIVVTDSGKGTSKKPTVVAETSLEYTRFPGYADLHLNAECPYVYLSNPACNTVYMKYSIYDEKNNLLYETNPIAVGKEVEADFVSFLEPGTHTLIFVQSTYDVDTETECNGATTQVKVIVD